MDLLSIDSHNLSLKAVNRSTSSFLSSIGYSRGSPSVAVKYSNTLAKNECYSKDLCAWDPRQYLQNVSFREQFHWHRLKIRVLIEILEATKSSVVILVAVARLSVDMGLRRCAHVSSFLSCKNSTNFRLSA